MTTDEKRTAVGDPREHERDHYFSSYWLTQGQPQFKLLILWAHRLLMTDSAQNNASILAERLARHPTSQ